jgi:hypothetical protein
MQEVLINRRKLVGEHLIQALDHLRLTLHAKAIRRCSA